MQGSSAERKEFDAYWRGIGERYNRPGWGNVSVDSSADVGGCTDSVGSVNVASSVDLSSFERPVLSVRDKVSQAFSLMQADEDE